MDAKEKAKELFDRYYVFSPNEYDKMYELLAKQCALICVDEIINTYHSPMDDEQIEEWQLVKQEIEKL